MFIIQKFWIFFKGIRIDAKQFPEYFQSVG